MEIDWDAVQQILTLLVLFVAPAILNFLRGNKDQEEEEGQENLFDVQPPPAARPSHRRVKQTAPPRVPLGGENASRGQKAPSAPVKVELASTSSAVPKYRQAKALDSEFEIKARKGGSGKLGKLSKSQVRRAWVLKEVLEEPRALKPF